MGWALLVPPLFLLPSAVRGFVLGAGMTAELAALVTLVGYASGSTSYRLGILAEEMTIGQLARLQGEGWRVLNNARFRVKGDIDHVLVGPGGAVVLETKWMGGGRSSEHYLEQAQAQAADLTTLVGSMVTRWIPRSAVRGAVVVWSPEEARTAQRHSGIHVVAGRDLSGWVQSLPGAGLGPASLDAAFDRLREMSSSREAHEVRVGFREAQPIDRMILGFLCGVLGAAAGLAAAVFSFEAVRTPGYWLLAAALSVAGVLAARLRRPLNEAARFFVCAVIGTSVAYALILTADMLL